MTQHRALALLVITLMLLILTLAAVGISYVTTRPTHVATAEFRVLDVQPLVSTQASRSRLRADPAGNAQFIAETLGELARSEMVLLQAVRTDEVKSLPVIRRCEDPVGFLRTKLRVTIRRPAVIELAIPCQPKEGDEYRIIVSAIGDAFVDATNRHEIQLAADRLEKLKAILADLSARHMRGLADLESLAQTLGVELSDDVQRATPNPLLVRRNEKMLDVLADEITRIEVAMIVDGNYERETRTETLKRLRQEYDRQTQELVQVLESQQSRNPRPRRSFSIDLKKRELERQQQHIDLVADQIFQTELNLEMPSRIELISSGTLTEL